MYSVYINLQAKTSIEYRNKSKSVAKITKVLGESGGKLLDSPDTSDQVCFS